MPMRVMEPKEAGTTPRQPGIPALDKAMVEMNWSVRLSLMIPRRYLMGMMLMLLYHVLDMAGAFHTLP
jgi:hypothetical protein